MNAESPDNVIVSGLFCYPVKSLRVTPLDEAEFDITGIRNDRAWMVVDARATPHTFVTQRDWPMLATVSATLTPRELRLSHETFGDVTIDTALPAHALARVKVWSSELVALDAGDAAAAWIGRVLGESSTRFRLVKFHPSAHRECSTRYAGDSGAHTFFADGYPVLITNQSSLDDLNQRIGRAAASALPMNRFRANLVLTGLPAWDEDHVDEITVGDVRLRLVKPCVRCVMTTTNQQSGARLSDEPLNTLARFRNNPDLGGVTFGWNAIVVSPGRVRVGDRAEIAYRF